MEDYLELPTEGMMITGLTPNFSKDFQKMVQIKLQEMKDNP